MTLSRELCAVRPDAATRMTFSRSTIAYPRSRGASEHELQHRDVAAIEARRQLKIVGRPSHFQHLLLDRDAVARGRQLGVAIDLQAERCRGAGGGEMIDLRH